MKNSIWRANKDVMITGRIRINGGTNVKVIGECIEDLTGASQYKISLDDMILTVYQSFFHKYFFLINKKEKQGKVLLIKNKGKIKL